MIVQCTVLQGQTTVFLQIFVVSPKVSYERLCWCLFSHWSFISQLKPSPLTQASHVRGDSLICIEVISVAVNLIPHDERDGDKTQQSSKHHKLSENIWSANKPEGNCSYELGERCTETSWKKVHDFAPDSGFGSNPLSTLWDPVTCDFHRAKARKHRIS